MIRHLTAADFRRVPWANGKGTTIEMARHDRDGVMQWRLSRASVVEDGDFSIFAEVERNLTVLTGPGFDLVGEGINLQARPFAPVAFPGDVALRAVNVTAPSDDFNVMTARALPRPEVRVLREAARLAPPAVGLLAVYKPEQGSLVLADEPYEHVGLGPALAVFLQV